MQRKMLGGRMLLSHFLEMSALQHFQYSGLISHSSCYIHYLSALRVSLEQKKFVPLNLLKADHCITVVISQV